MPRGKRKVKKHLAQPDPIYHSTAVTKLVGSVLKSGKKSLAQKIVYTALERASVVSKEDSLALLKRALLNVSPSQEVRSRRVGGATYQIPMPVRSERKEALAIRFIIEAARSRKGTPMAEALAKELVAAAKNEGEAVKKKENMQKMAEANRAFAHFRW